MGVAQSKKRLAEEIEASDGAVSTEENFVPSLLSNERDILGVADERSFIELTVAAAAEEPNAVAAAAEEPHAVTVAAEEPNAVAAAAEEPHAVTVAAEEPHAVAAAAEEPHAVTVAAEEPHAVGNVVYLLTFLGFLAWLFSQQNDNDTKLSYCKTACTRISDFLTFLGNTFYTAVLCLLLIILPICISERLSDRGDTATAHPCAPEHRARGPRKIR